MKTNIVGVIIALVLAAIFSANVMAKDEVRVSEVRKVESYSSIEITSVATIYFVQGSPCSLKIEGVERNVKETVTYVKGDKLYIDWKDKNGDSRGRNRKNGVTLYLTAPDLKSVEFEGVGSFNCDAPLRLDDVKFEVEGVGQLNVKDLTCRRLSVSVEGVGKADINVNCDYLRADLDGVGRVKLSGWAKQADISKDGIGSVNTNELKTGE